MRSQPPPFQPTVAVASFRAKTEFRSPYLLKTPSLAAALTHTILAEYDASPAILQDKDSSYWPLTMYQLPADTSSCTGSCFGDPIEDPKVLASLHGSRNHLNASIAGPALRTVVQEYQYTPLRDWEIRILDLTPGSKGSPLEGRMVTATIMQIQGRSRAVASSQSQTADHEINYNALSYCWGSSNKEASMFIEGKRMPITKNLRNALNELRREKETMYIWIDALCINQDETDQGPGSEKSKQLAKMLDVYQAATKVYVWIGQSDPLSRLSIDRLQQLRNIRASPGRSLSVGTGELPKRNLFEWMKDKDYWYELYFTGTYQRSGEEEISYENVNYTTSWSRLDNYSQFSTRAIFSREPPRRRVVHTFECQQTQQRLYHTLRVFYSRDWLNRTWVRQEVFGSKEIGVVCGGDRITWDTFLRGRVVLDELENALADGEDQAGSQGPMMERARQAPQIIPAPKLRHAQANLQSLEDLTTSPPGAVTQTRQFRSLVDTLLAMQGLEVTKQHDRIFAVLGMCGVPSANIHEGSLAPSPNGIMIGYTQSMERTLLETTRYLLQKRPEEDNPETLFDVLADIFNYKVPNEFKSEGIVKLHLQSEGSSAPEYLQSWVVDWRSCCSAEEVRVIREKCLPYNPQRHPGGTRRYRPRPENSPLIPFIRFQPIVWPRVQPDGSLLIHGLVLDVVESVTERTSYLMDFLHPVATDHRTHKWKKVKFSHSRHPHRYAVLVDNQRREWTGARIVPSILVPATTRPGDLIIAIAPGVLPLVISPEGANVDESEVLQLSKNERRKAERPYESFKGISSVLQENRRYVFRGAVFGEYAFYGEGSDRSQYIKEPVKETMISFYLV